MDSISAAAIPGLARGPLEGPGGIAAYRAGPGWSDQLKQIPRPERLTIER